MDARTQMQEGRQVLTLFCPHLLRVTRRRCSSSSSSCTGRRNIARTGRELHLHPPAAAAAAAAAATAAGAAAAPPLPRLGRRGPGKLRPIDGRSNR